MKNSVTETIANLSPIETAIKILKENQLVVIPTETVYGLAANAFSPVAIQKIFQVKNRPASNPLIVHIASKDRMEQIAINIPDEAHQLADSFWPGPLTLVLEKAANVPSIVTAGKNTVGVRVPDHPLTRQLLEKLPFPLVAPSANRSNHISPTNPQHVLDSLGKEAPFILDGGDCTRGIESTIIGFEKGVPEIYRFGAISKEEIENVLSCRLSTKTPSDLPLAPGMFKKHYSPEIPLIATNDVNEAIERNAEKNIGVIYYNTKNIRNKKYPCRVLSLSGDLNETAANLYKSMYELEKMDLELIIAELLPDEGIGASINDRLNRAASR